VRQLSIGQIAKAADIKVVTIRYYERIRVMPKARRTDGNYRAYTTQDLRKLRFIRRCRDLGFTLDQIRELMRLSLQGSEDCSAVYRITARHLADIEDKIADLRQLAKELRRITKSCEGGNAIADCRIIEALAAY
jgi:Cu(I)-responsive transcriptional regulator